MLFNFNSISFWINNNSNPGFDSYEAVVGTCG
jgi:hypothetical protein